MKYAGLLDLSGENLFGPVESVDFLSYQIYRRKEDKIAKLGIRSSDQRMISDVSDILSDQNIYGMH